ncbi:MAG: SPOR domain-containing protein [Lysobacter sp.]|nr:SPOR domain-containing protein [Lysobacter sp.]
MVAAAIERNDTPRGEDVTLQVASFSARSNADRALGMLKNAGIDDARLLDGNANGQKVWRLRVGPLQAAAAPELAARIVGLGFGQPQRVRDRTRQELHLAADSSAAARGRTSRRRSRPGTAASNARGGRKPARRSGAPGTGGSSLEFQRKPSPGRHETGSPE